jgi:hypothetical protein
VHRSRAARVAIAADRSASGAVVQNPSPIRAATSIWPPRHNVRITSTASSSISSRVSAGGQRSPMMCSFSASPLPTPSWKRPSSRIEAVAAACAITAGWMRTVGHVTPVVTRMFVACAIAPIVPHTNGL